MCTESLDVASIHPDMDTWASGDAQVVIRSRVTPALEPVNGWGTVHEGFQELPRLVNSRGPYHIPYTTQAQAQAN